MLLKDLLYTVNVVLVTGPSRKGLPAAAGAGGWQLHGHGEKRAVVRGLRRATLQGTSWTTRPGFRERGGCCQDPGHTPLSASSCQHLYLCQSHRGKDPSDPQQLLAK